MGVHTKQVGVFREIFPGERRAPSMVPLLSDSPQPDEDLLVAYLKAGHVTSACGHVNRDAFAPNQPIPPLAMQTDGTWTWPNVLAYYVERYHCRLPDEFVSHVRQRTGLG